MTKDKVTRDDLRQMTVGKTVIFVLPTAQKCVSAQVMCSYLKQYEGIEFSTSIDPANRTISITRKK